MKKIRIAFIAATLDVGGAENVLVDLITRLPADRFESECYFLGRAGTLGAELMRRGYRAVERIQRHRTDPAVVWRLASLLKSFSPQVVYLLDHRNALFGGGLCSSLTGVGRRVVASHSTGRMDGRKSFGRIDRLFMGSTAAVIALSESHARYLEREEAIDPRRIQIIQNGIETSCYEMVDANAVRALREALGIAPGDRVVIMVASLRPEKAHEALLEAARSLIAERPILKFFIVGDGPRRSPLERMSRSLGLGQHVFFLGERRDVPELLHVADVLVLPSHAAVETLPLALLEAMAAGVPVVASAVGSVPDLITDGVNGTLIGPADADGLQGAIRGIIDNSQETAKIVETARETVRTKYTVDRMVAGYRALFERLAN